jgi:hypothetical protein
VWVFFSTTLRPSKTITHLPIPWHDYEKVLVAFVHLRHTDRLACLKCDRAIGTARPMPRYNEENIRRDLMHALDGFGPIIEKVDDALGAQAYDAILPIREVVLLKLRAEPFPPPF